MRVFTLLAFAALAACSKIPEKVAAAKPAEVAFDGAQFTNASAQEAHGQRLSWVLGCRGCHGKGLEGHRFYERYASNLTRELPNYSDEQIVRVLHTGVPRDGRELWGMPSQIFQHLGSADMGALIAHLRTVAPAGKPTQPPLPWEDDAKALIAKGEIKDAKDTVLEEKPLAPVDLGPDYALGRYITMVTCAECHGPKLEGGGVGGPPNLVVAGGYTRDEFETLLTKGIPTGGRKLDLMAEVAKERFVRFTPHERDAIYAYLKARAEQAR